MFPHALRTTLILAATFAAATGVAGSSRERSAAGPSVLWRFHVGSTVSAAPAVNPDGVIFVGTSDGSVEALNPNGILRFSYMLRGSVAFAPVVDRTARVFVATTAARLYSFPTDELGWQVRTPAHVVTDPVLAAPWGILFGGDDTGVWAYSSHGAPLWHAHLGARIVAGPAPVVDGHTMVATADGDVWLLNGAVKRAVAHLGCIVHRIAGVFPDGSGVVVADHTAFDLDAKGAVKWQREGIEWLTVDRDEMLAIDSAHSLVILRGDGTERSSTPLGAEASDAPARSATGDVYVPTSDGALLVVSRGGVRSVPIAHESLHRPVFDAARRRVIVVSGGGVVASVNEGGDPASHSNRGTEEPSRH